MGPENYIPVIYKNEVEGANLLSYIPYIIMWGKQLIIYFVNCYDSKTALIFICMYVLQLSLKYILGFLIFLIRRSAEVMSGKGGKRGGLFGQVMESTAKLINSKDIGVRFK